MSLLPASMRREVSLGHEVIVVLDRARVEAWWVRAQGIAVLCCLGVSLLGAVIGLFWAVYVGVGLVFAFALLALGLFALPVERMLSPAPLRMRIDPTGLSWGGLQVTWDEVDAIRVEPFPFVDESYVYCLVVQVGRESLRLGSGQDASDLEQLASYLRAKWQACRSTGSPAEEDDGVEALSALRQRE